MKTFDWQFAVEIFPTVLKGLWVTVQAVVVGMSLAIVLGLVWAILRRSKRRALSWPASGVVEFVRGTPLLVQLYFLFYITPDIGIRLSPFLTGVIGLGLHYSAYTAEVYRAGIDGVPMGQWQAATALNMSRYHTFKNIILPQAIPPVIPALGNYLVAMFKDAPLLSAITVVEVLQMAKVIGAEKFRYFEPFTIVGVLFLIMSLCSAVFIQKLETTLEKEESR